MNNIEKINMQMQDLESRVVSLEKRLYSAEVTVSILERENKRLKTPPEELMIPPMNSPELWNRYNLQPGNGPRGVHPNYQSQPRPNLQTLNVTYGMMGRGNLSEFGGWYGIEKDIAALSMDQINDFVRKVDECLSDGGISKYIIHQDPTKPLSILGKRDKDRSHVDWSVIVNEENNPIFVPGKISLEGCTYIHPCKVPEILAAIAKRIVYDGELHTGGAPLSIRREEPGVWEIFSDDNHLTTIDVQNEDKKDMTIVEITNKVEKYFRDTRVNDFIFESTPNGKDVQLYVKPLGLVNYVRTKENPLIEGRELTGMLSDILSYAREVLIKKDSSASNNSILKVVHYLEDGWKVQHQSNTYYMLEELGTEDEQSV